MKHIKFCPIRKNISRIIFVGVALIFLDFAAGLVLALFNKVVDTLSYTVVLVIFLLLFIVICVGTRGQYCKREIAFWSILTKKA